MTQSLGSVDPSQGQSKQLHNAVESEDKVEVIKPMKTKEVTIQPMRA